ncbi:MAG: universal stress protein [Enhydrobacter sp.]|nr:MAG: universal stress protein [Enhydrobacter sp.]
MKRIFVATDFSTRSDRALRRAVLLARRTSVDIVLVHVVDDDQPARLVTAREREARELLAEFAATLHGVDGVDCDTRVLLGEPSEQIAEAAANLGADVVVMGPHRRQALRDVFVGTTLDRTIRRSGHPIVVANAAPAGPYGRVLVATDFSPGSAAAAKAMRTLRFLDGLEVVVLHAFEASAQRLLVRSSMTMDQWRDYLAQEEARAAEELAKFLKEVNLAPTRGLVRLADPSPAAAIRACARAEKADLVVMGTHGRTGPAKLLLGSVTEDVLRDADIDVLVVPAAR